MNRAYAHSKPGRPPEEWEPLEEHLERVAALASNFAEPFGASDAARLVGLWHDLGKYRPAFQDYLSRSSNPSSPDLSDKGRVDHSTAGAIHSAAALGHPQGPLLAYLIAGHHAGLPDATGSGGDLRSRLQQAHLLAEAIGAGAPDRILAPGFSPSPPRSRRVENVHLWLRMLFSSLVDADFLATEEFIDGPRSAARSPYPSLADLEGHLSRYLAERFGAPTTSVALARGGVLSACLNAAALPPGLFSLSVPTGGGKTLSGTAFALRHAVLHGLQRLIYVIPFTTIAEQTANVLREIFGDCVLEHHSNVDPDDSNRETPRSRLSAENWDAPIVITTNVQFFESFYAARTSRCRKLHNVARSVVILDEAQALPTAFLDPIRHLLANLAADYGVSILVSTATQPALGLEGVREIIPDPPDLARHLQRVTFEWPESTEPTSWSALAASLSGHRQVLCVVGRRDDARHLASILPAGSTVHLSALMCGAHRSDCIESIRRQLAAGDEIRVVSTQLVEAGVDVDFPIVYRAFAGLDSIAQAGGRANREGRLPGLGRVVVFHSPSPVPRGLLRKAADATRSTLAGRRPSFLDLDDFNLFFGRFFASVNSLDEHDILGLLQRDSVRSDIQFRTVAEKFRLVDDSAYRSVLVWYGYGRQLAVRLDVEPPNRKLLRRLQRFVVSIPDRQLRSLVAGGEAVESASVPGLFVQQTEGLYDRQFGLQLSVPEFDPVSLVV